MSQYIVWGVGATVAPKVIHDSRPYAIKVAYKLAADNPGERFYVCKLVGVVEAGSPKYSDMEHD